MAPLWPRRIIPRRPLIGVGVLLIVWLGLAAAFSHDARAGTYRLRTQSRARASQHLRADQRWEASRTWTQALHLSAFDLLDDASSSLNAHLSLRYFTDAALDVSLREDARAFQRFNALTLDRAYLHWRPFDALEVRAGRHWTASALGVADIDGITTELQRPSGNLRPFARVWAGRQVHAQLGAFDPGLWDVQGLPLNDPYTHAPQATLLGAAAGLHDRRDRRLEIAASRSSRARQTTDTWADTAPPQHEHRLGVSATTRHFQRLHLSTLLTYHGPARALDRALLTASLRLGEASSISAGLDHRLPIFDAASIFNLFGAAPRQSAFLTLSHPINALHTTLEARAWARAYHDHPASPGIPDELTPGTALASRSRLTFLKRPALLHTQLSYQSAGPAHTRGAQLLFDASLTLAASPGRLWLSARHLTLYVTPDAARQNAAFATGSSLGAEVGLGQAARLSLLAEHRRDSHTPSHLLLMANLTLELGP
ncbi:hypothetical protein DL240_02330 [Lujinxingia litoralis]|uniref:Alginate export domain-containing protein n=1 Tax=Lujinxingia litoralis TaxID=2211119 RepID=A0A328CAC4_9DELT|nr:hypothetical protein [Lujinxingia litoralis]RAL25072.1 hypothetical protein DL240_02330 [Lujinxingia litoralis]